MRVTRRESKRLEEEFHDASCMAQRGMWCLAETKRFEESRNERK